MIEHNLISVVIPNYNRENLIVEALESVKAQDYRPIELIVVDDGSTDNSVTVVKDWIKNNESKNFYGLLIEQENKGGNVARNTGISYASAEYIAFLDSDDLWKPGKLSKQLDVLINEVSAGAVYCGLEHVEAQTAKLISTSNRTYAQGNILSQILISDITAPTSCYMVKSKVFKKVGSFDEELQARQDWDMWIRIASKYNIFAIEENLVSYRHHTGERTASNPQKEINAYARIREKYKSLLLDQDASVRKKADSAYYKRMARVYFHHKISRSKAFKYYVKAIALNPFDFDNYAAFAGFFVPKSLRQKLHEIWNKLFGKTKLAIRSH